jgi:hypothetical protein
LPISTKPSSQSQERRLFRGARHDL